MSELTNAVKEKIDMKDTDLPEKIKCQNEQLAGKTHDETGVPFERKQVEVDGKKYEVTVPNFESYFNVQLPENLYKETDYMQFKECNLKLKEELAVNDRLKSIFNTEQCEQIENGDTPDDYIWHHDAEVGKMQFVDLETHQKTNHTGGRRIWGGGTQNR